MAATLSPWTTCLRCLRQQKRAFSQRLYATATIPAQAATATASAASPAVHEIPQDDAALRAVFDNSFFWKSFSRWRQPGVTGKSVGLFGNRYLQSPDGFERWAYSTLRKCKKIVAKVLAVNTIEGYQGLIKDLDRLSDLLCRIIDLADFVRSTHPNHAFHQAATNAHVIMFEYMNELNTTPGLWQQLSRAMSISEVTRAWSEEEHRTAEILKKDFEQSAIQLPRAVRERFVHLSSRINELGARFVDGMCPARGATTIPKKKMDGLNQTFIRRFEGNLGRVSVPSVGAAANTVLRHAHDESVRRQVYIGSRTSAPGPIDTLEEFLAMRSELAKVSGFGSHGHMALENKMAGTPQSVVQFLDSLSAAKSPEMRQTLHDVAIAKGGKPEPWDMDYYNAQRPTKGTGLRLPEEIPTYFSLGTVMQGLSRLFHRLYGVRLVPRETGVGETWTSDVRRLDVVSDTEGLIAVLYCDLFARVGKSPNPAHFTIRCSRHIPQSEIEQNAEEDDFQNTPNPSIVANDGMAIRQTASGEIFQLPTIALICDFSPPSFLSSAPPLLEPGSLATLFHEMGHAIHSFLGRTRFQNVSGTRCATDFAELPSVLMERFATDPDVLGLYARHYETDKPLPAHFASAIQSFISAGESAPETEGQIMLARIDQALHGESVGGRPGWSDEVIQQVYRRHSSLGEPAETRAQGFFGHLVGYGSTYYAYLFDRAIAGRVWQQVFNSGSDGGAIDREAGERFASEVLRWGGSRNPWACVGGVMGGDEGAVLSEGGEKAMQLVGRWGVGKA